MSGTFDAISINLIYCT